MNTKLIGIMDILIGLCDLLVAALDIATGQYIWAAIMIILGLSIMGFGIYFLVKKE